MFDIFKKKTSEYVSDDQKKLNILMDMVIKFNCSTHAGIEFTSTHHLSRIERIDYDIHNSMVLHETLETNEESLVDSWKVRDYRDKINEIKSQYKSKRPIPKITPVLSGGIKWYKVEFYNSSDTNVDYFKTKKEADNIREEIINENNAIEEHNKEINELDIKWTTLYGEKYREVRNRVLEDFVKEIEESLLYDSTLLGSVLYIYYNRTPANYKISSICFDAYSMLKSRIKERI